MSEKQIVILDRHEQEAIEKLLQKGKVAARRLKRANILRLAHANYTDVESTKATAASLATVERTRAKFVQGGLDWALAEEARSGAPAKLDGKQRLFWWRWLAPPRPPDIPAGPCNCWRIACANCKSSKHRFPLRRYDVL